jgi:hypothetical protein
MYNSVDDPLKLAALDRMPPRQPCYTRAIDTPHDIHDGGACSPFHLGAHTHDTPVFPLSLFLSSGG